MTSQGHQVFQPRGYQPHGQSKEKDVHHMPRLRWRLKAAGFQKVKGSSAHANPGHMYTQRPFSSLTVTCARKTTVTCTHQRSHGHMYTQARSSAHAKRRSHVHTSDTTVTCTHHYSGYGVGWSDNVHVSVHAQARQPYHLSGCSADTGTTQPCVPLNYCLHFTSLFKLPPPVCH